MDIVDEKRGSDVQAVVLAKEEQSIIGTKKKKNQNTTVLEMGRNIYYVMAKSHVSLVDMWKYAP